MISRVFFNSSHVFDSMHLFKDEDTNFGGGGGGVGGCVTNGHGSVFIVKRKHSFSGHRRNSFSGGRRK